MSERGRASSLARVRRVVAAGARIASTTDALGREARARLVRAGGLSAEGVELALGQHLEVRPSPAELEALVAAAGQAPRCHVVLAANVCTAALRALAFAAATSARVLVRPSRRDPVLAELLCGALGEDRDFAAMGASVELALDLSPELGDELHLYGSDATLERLAGAAAEGVLVRAHGTGFGLSCVGAGVDLAAAAPLIARDVVPFDQQGCLSPRMVLVEGPPERAEALARALHEELARFDAAVPRGALDAATRAAVAGYRATMQAVGLIHEGPGHLVGVDVSPRSLPLPPPARVVHVASVSAELGRALVSPWAPALTVLGAAAGDASALAAGLRALAPFARALELGAMQRPPLDGPVDLRPARPR